MNFGDMARLRYKDLIKGRIYYSRHKTQKLLSFQLVPNAVQIVGKYSKTGHAKEDISFRFSIAMSIGHHNRFSIGHIRCWQKSIGN